MRLKYSIPTNLIDVLSSYSISVSDVVLYVNSTCNLRCKHCYIGNDLLNLGNTIETESILNFLNSIDKISRITVLGGEPFLHSGINNILNQLNRSNISEKRITTNLTKITNENIELISKGNSRICVSLDGYSEELHEEIRGRSTFKKTINNISKLVEQDVDIEVTHTVTNSNIDYLEKLIDLLSSLGVRRLNLHKLSIKGNAVLYNLKDVTPTAWRNLLKRITNLNDKKGILLRYQVGYVTKAEYSILKMEGKYRHHAFKSFYANKGQRIVIYPDGKIYISSESFGEENYIGSFQNGTFEYNNSIANEIKLSSQESFNISKLNTYMTGDKNFPVGLSVSFRESMSI